MYTTRTPSKKRRWFARKKLLTIAAVIVVLLLALVVLEKTGVTNLVKLPKKEDSRITNPGPSNSTADSEKGESTGANNNGGASGSTVADTPPAGDNKNPDATADPNTPLREPTGVFVSNHRPNISGQPAPKTINSNCTTTPGATCQILFIKDGVTKALPPQTTDRGGTAYWSWSVDDAGIGLSTGTWQVQAKATLGSQVKTANDATPLEVRP